MICSKCNSEIPNGARFCTVCGAPCGMAADIKPVQPQAPGNKYFCRKCGLELQFGAKFCTACGAPAANVGDVAPLNNNGATFGNGNMAAVSLNKEPTSNDLVAAMNMAAPAPAPVAAVPAPAVPEPAPAPVAAAPAPAVPEPVPAPVAAAPAPVIPEPVPAPVAAAPAPVVPEPAPAPVAAAPAPVIPEPAPAPAASYNNGFSSAPGAAPAAPGVPPFAPAGNFGGPQLPNGDVNGLGAAVAVATTTPAKKKNGGKIALIIGIVLVVILGAAAAFFFTNKATFLSTFMGKPKYAAMVEKESLKKAAEELDTKALASQIKSVSGLISALSNGNINPSNPLPSLSLGNTEEDAQFAKLTSYSNVTEGVDVKALLKGYSEMMKSQYGVSRIYGSMSADFTLGSELSGSSLYGEDLNEIIGLINGSEITYDYAVTDKMLGAEFGVNINNKPLNAQMILQDDGSTYIVFPFVSDTALKIKLPTVEGTTATTSTSATLDLDDEELKRLINETVEIYTDYIKDSSVTMEKGSMDVAGITVSGKQIVADINGANLDNLAKAVIEHIANDQYVCSSVVSYVQSFYPEFTEQEYKNSVSELINNISGSNENQKLIVTTIVTNNGSVLAKSYELSDNGKQIAQIKFANNDTDNAFEIKSGSESVMTVKTQKTGEKDGVTTINMGVGNSASIGVVVTYTGADKAEFGKSQMPVGSYNVKFDTSNLSGVDSEVMKVFNGFSLDLTSSVENGTAKCTLGVNIPDVIKCDLKMNMTLTDDVSKFSAPGKSIDLTPVLNGVLPDNATIEELQEYVMDILNGLGDVFEGTEFEDYIEEIIGDINNPGQPSIPNNPVTPNKPTTPDNPPTPNNPETPNKPVNVNNIKTASDLEDAVFNSLYEVYDWYDEYKVYTGDPYENAMAYQEELRELDSRIWDVIDDCTDKQLEAFKKEYSQIVAKRDSIKNALMAASTVNNNNGNTSGGNTSGGNTSGSNTSGGNTSGSNTSGSNTSGSNTSGSNTSGSNTSGSNTSGSNTSGGNTNHGNTSGSNTNSGNTSHGSTSGNSSR